MNSNEESFPRSNNWKNKTIHSSSYMIPEDEQLFKSRKKISSKLGRNKNKTRKNNSDLKRENLNKTVIENLSLNRLIENMIIYGCLQEISDFELKFSITGGITVKVPITNISTPYTRLIENFANNTDVIEVPKLTSMFNIGDFFPIKILLKKICDKFGHTEVIGTINPKDIYCNFNVGIFQKLPTNYNLIAAVVSREDHGYLMDLGVDDVKAFLLFEDLQRNSHNIDLNIGQLIHCSLCKVSERSISLTINPKLFDEFVLEEDHNPNILFYSPGIKTNATIIGLFNSGLELTLPGGYKGFVPRYHLNNNLSISPKQFKIGDVMQGYILYVHPHTKQVCLSFKTKLKRKKIKKLIDSIRSGLIIKNATVCFRSQFGGLIFKLPPHNYAIALKKNLFEPKEEFNEDILHNIYSIGSSHIARIKKFHLFDNLIEISLRKSFIEREDDISLDDIEIASIVEGTIKKYRPDGIYVKLGFRINGFIPNIHLTDTPFLNWEMNHSRLFPIKKKIKCRVLKMDHSSRIPKIALTAKKTLLEINNDEIFKDLNHIKPGMSSIGVVCLITDKGILLEFFNYLRGFIPLKYLATYKIEHPDKVFQIGQLVKCTVLSIDIDSQRMICSLINIDESKKLKQTLRIKNKNNLMNSKLKIGQILKRLKIISKIPMKGFDLTNIQEKIQVFLPIFHLSDDPQLSLLLFSAYKIDDIIDEVMVFSKDSVDVVCVTGKPTFLGQNYQLVTKEEDIKINSPFPAIVRRVTSNGVFFGTPNSQYGVIRRKYLQDGFFEDPKKLDLSVGQTIFVNAIDIATFEPIDCNENCLKRFKFSMKLSHIFNKDTNIRIEIFKTYLNQCDISRSLLQNSSEDDVIKRLASYSVGQVVTFVITEITNDYIKVDVSLNGKKNELTVVGIASKYTDFGELSISQMGNAIVCDIDFQKKNLILFLQPKPAKLIHQVKNFQKTNLSKLKCFQTVKGIVIHINEKYILVILSGHIPGLIAFIPARKHYNDLRHIEKLYSIGQSYPFLIEHFDLQGEKIQVLVTLNDSSNKKSNGVTTKDNSKNEPINVEINNKVADKFELRKLSSKDKPSSVDKFDWDVIDLSKINNKRKLDDLKKPDDDENDIGEMAWDDSDEEIEIHKKRKTRGERNEEAHQRESLLREKENELTDTNRTPKDEQDFEMAVIASPNSSLIWIKYMAFFLDQKEIDKARQIGERALRKISFREEKERFNIWVSLLNLENNYGDEKTMKELIEKAIKFNDTKKIYSSLAIIYNESNKKEKAEEIHKLLTKKFHSDESVWYNLLAFYMSNGQIEVGHKFFVKALNSLDKRFHVDFIDKFAQLEFRYGDCEEGKSIYETLLTTFWKRLDKWSIYIDVLIKYTINNNKQNIDVDALEYIRNIFERLLTLKFSPHRMKFIFKKYYDFELKYSGENVEILEKIKQRANEYVENGINF